MLNVEGRGEAYWETGTEGVLWAVVVDEKPGYDGLYILKDGDRLTVFDRDNQAKVLWSGVVDLEYESNKQHATYNPNYVAQAVFNHWVHGLQRDLDAETWAQYFFSGNPMTFERACGWEAFRKEPEANIFQRGWLESLNVSDPNMIAMLSVKNARFTAEGTIRFMYKQTIDSTIHLTTQDIRNLRDACDALLRANPERSNHKDDPGR